MVPMLQLPQFTFSLVENHCLNFKKKNAFQVELFSIVRTIRFDSGVQFDSNSMLLRVALIN